jgi:hypothetical protein
VSYPVLAQIGSSAEWVAADPVLRDHVIAFTSDSGQYKIGDGVSHWSALPYTGGFGTGDWDTAS